MNFGDKQSVTFATDLEPTGGNAEISVYSGVSQNV